VPSRRWAYCPLEPRTAGAIGDIGFSLVFQRFDNPSLCLFRRRVLDLQGLVLDLHGIVLILSQNNQIDCRMLTKMTITTVLPRLGSSLEFEYLHKMGSWCTRLQIKRGKNGTDGREGPDSRDDLKKWL
jgi:hypothetical protein